MDLLLLCVFGFFSVFTYQVASDKLIVVGDARPLNLIPSVEVKGSLGLKPEVTTLCERLHVFGFRSRYYHMHKYPTSLKLIVKASTSDDIHVCFHIISSRAIGMCPHNMWKKVFNGTLIQRSSPFGNQIMDVRVANSSSSKNVPLIKVYAEEEWFMHRIVYLILGTVLLSLTTILRTRAIAFYFLMSLIAGYFLIVLFVLFQGIKRLPTRLNTSALLLVISIILSHCIPDWYQSILSMTRFDKAENNTTGKKVICVVQLQIVGSILGLEATYFFVRNKDGSINADKNTFLFVSSSFWILAAVLILKSSSDIFLAGGALVSVIVVTRLICLLGLDEILINLLQIPRISNHFRRLYEPAMKRKRERELYNRGL